MKRTRLNVLTKALAKSYNHYPVECSVAMPEGDYLEVLEEKESQFVNLIEKQLSKEESNLLTQSKLREKARKGGYAYSEDYRPCYVSTPRINSFN